MDPPLRVPPAERPLSSWVMDALDVLYSRPSPEGPPPIPVPVEKAIHFEGKGPIIQVLPGDIVYADHLPELMRTALPKKGPFSNHVVQLEEGQVRVVAVDRTLNDTKLSRDSMALELSFTDHRGDRWRIVQTSLAPLSPSPVSEPWFGGLAIDTLYHGEQSPGGTPAEPLVDCALCSWGWADIWKNDKKVQSSTLLHVMLTSRTRAGADEGFAYQCYDCTGNPVEEVHIIVPPTAYLPTPGGFLHVMWENADARKGSPAEVLGAAPELEEPLQTITLRAVPHLQWSETEIHVEAGKRYRLVLMNEDPVADHAFNLHMRRGMPPHTDPVGAGDMPWRAPSDELPGAEHKIHVPLPHGSHWSTTIEFDEPGEYHFGCPVMNHMHRGMMGKFIVSAPEQRRGGSR